MAEIICVKRYLEDKMISFEASIRDKFINIGTRVLADNRFVEAFLHRQLKSY